MKINEDIITILNNKVTQLEETDGHVAMAGNAGTIIGISITTYPPDCGDTERSRWYELINNLRVASGSLCLNLLEYEQEQEQRNLTQADACLRALRQCVDQMKEEFNGIER